MFATPGHEYDEFEILVGNSTAQGYPVALIHAPAGECSTFCLCNPTDDEMLDALAALEGGTVDASFVRDFGHFLFSELFTGDLATLYRSSLSMVRGQGKHLRLRLRFDSPELAHLPWEYLYDRDEESFLAISPSTALVRHIPLRLPTRPTRVQLPLRILLVIASPSDLPQLDVEQERTIIEQALTESIKAGKIEMQIVEQATLAATTQATRTFQPHIFHFVGHGQFEHQSAAIVLQDDVGKAHLVDERLFREVFAGANEMRLAVLNACQTATLSATQPLVGIAPRLLQRNLSAVVAMQFPIADGSALVFAREFYRSLAASYPVEAAVAEARKGMLLAADGKCTDWGAPVLFLRAKDGRLFDLQTEQTPAFIAPPEPIKPPATVNFIGRQAEQSYYLQCLQQHRVAILNGMAGVGKTSLAVVLAAHLAEPSKVFWHTFHANEAIDTMLWKLAGFLAWNGKPEPWQVLQSTVAQGGQPPPPAILFDMLMQSMAGQGFVLCFDDLHQLADEPLLPRLMERAQTALRSDNLHLIVTTRRLLDLGFEPSFTVLSGMSEHDGLQLLRERGVILAAEQSVELYNRCAGNAELLTLAANALHQTKDAARTLQYLSESSDIERFLLEEVDKYLSADEKAVMSAVAVLSMIPGTRDVLEEALDGANVGRTLSHLVNRHLLIVHEAETGREYSQHAIVQGFYYNLLGRRHRHEMHRRVGEYYEFEEVDDFRAALHYQRAGDDAKAAQLCVRNLSAHINQGRAQALLNLLTHLPLSQLDTGTQAAVLVAQGDLQHLLGGLTSAVQCYDTALRLGASIDRALQIQLWRKLGDVLARQGDYPRALSSFECGNQLLTVGDEAQAERALLAVGGGTVLMNLGRYAEAEAAAQLALTQKDVSNPSRHVADAHDLLGKIAYFRGEFDSSLSEFEHALELRQRMNDLRDVLKSYSNLAVVYGEQHRHEEALRANQVALEIAQRIGDTVAIANLFSNMGAECESLGRYEQALELHRKALALHQRMGSQAGVMTVYHNLGDIYRQLQQHDNAVEHLKLAIDLAERLNEPDTRLSSLSVMAEIEFECGNIASAFEQVMRSIQIANEIGHRQWLPFHLTLLGRIYYKQAEFVQARNAFREAAQVWHEQAAHKQLIRVWLDWAGVEWASGDHVQAFALCNQALVLASEQNEVELVLEAQKFQQIEHTAKLTL